MSAVSREAILTETRSWLGTPYQHQASVKGAGCDCLGLVRGVWRALYGPEPVNVPPYTADWDSRAQSDELLAAANRIFRPLQGKFQGGDVLLFRMRPGAVCKHMAIASGERTMIHAYWGRAVTESHLVPYWTSRLAGSFSFPDL